MSRHQDTIDEARLPELGQLLIRLSRAILIHQHEIAQHPEILGLIGVVEREAILVEHEVRWITALDPTTGELPAIPEQRTVEHRQTGRWIANAGTFIYVAYDHTGKVLYVGITDDLFARMGAHRHRSRWWQHVERIDWQEWPDRRTAERQEARLIRRYRPPYNKSLNPDWKPEPSR